jgi:hypothetical protein
LKIQIENGFRWFGQHNSRRQKGVQITPAMCREFKAIIEELDKEIAQLHKEIREGKS